jgi:competence protein ComEA
VITDPLTHSPRRSWRDLDLRAAAVICIVAAVSLLLGGWVLWRSRPHEVDVGPALAAATSPVVERRVPAAAPAPPPRADLVVDVEGAVRRPGIVTVPAGSRVRDVLLAAGGALPSAPAATVNLAEPVTDGEQILVGLPGSAAGSGARSEAGKPTVVNLNTAVESDLEGLPGIGPVMAQRVLDFRHTHGRFSSVDELREVPGIGPAKFAAIRNHVRV